MSCCEPTHTLHRVTFEASEAGAFSAGLLRMPYGFRISGPAAWQFSSGSATINVRNNGPRGSECGEPKTTLDVLMFSGDVDESGTFTLFVPLVRVEDIQYTFVP